MELVSITKGNSLGNGKTEVISNAQSKPIKAMIAADKVDEFIAQQQAAGTTNITIGKTNKNNTVEVYITPQTPKAQRYSVPDDKADEFISKQKKLAKTNLGIILTTTTALTTLAEWGMAKMLKNKSKWLKIPTMVLGGIVALGISFAASLNLMVPILNKQEKNILKQFDAERIR